MEEAERSRDSSRCLTPCRQPETERISAVDRLVLTFAPKLHYKLQICLKWQVIPDLHQSVLLTVPTNQTEDLMSWREFSAMDRAEEKKKKRRRKLKSASVGKMWDHQLQDHKNFSMVTDFLHLFASRFFCVSSNVFTDIEVTWKQGSQMCRVRRRTSVSFSGKSQLIKKGELFLNVVV